MTSLLQTIHMLECERELKAQAEKRLNHAVRPQAYELLLNRQIARRNKRK